MEIELKLLLTDVDHKTLADDLKSLAKVRAEHTQFLTNQYFDTPHLALRAKQMGLRIRQKGEFREQTLKTAGQSQLGLHSRPEYNREVHGPLPDLSAFPSALFGDERDGLQRQLAEQFATDFERHAIELVLGDGTELEVALDSGLIKAKGRTVAIDELELELIRGDIVQALKLAQSLGQRHCLRLGQASKAARGYRLAGLQPEPQLVTLPPETLEQGLVAWQTNEGVLLSAAEEFEIQARDALVTQFSGLSQLLMSSHPTEAIRLASMGQALMDAKSPQNRLSQLLAKPSYGQTQLTLLALVMNAQTGV